MVTGGVVTCCKVFGRPEAGYSEPLVLLSSADCCLFVCFVLLVRGVGRCKSLVKTLALNVGSWQFGMCFFLGLTAFEWACTPMEIY